MEQLFADLVDQLGTEFSVAEFVLGLRLEDGVLEANRHRPDHALADVVPFVASLGILVHRLEQALAECAEVRAAVGGVLAVDEREESLAVAAVGVGEAELQCLARVVERRIDGLGVVRLQVRHHEVEQAVARLEGVAVEDEQGRLVGLITCFEVLRELTRAISEGATAPLAVSSIMARDPLTIVPETLTLDAIALMRREKVDCLPVINQGRLVGIVTEYAPGLELFRIQGLGGLPT